MNELLNHADTVTSSKVNEEKICFIKEFYNIELTAGEDFNYQKACGNIAKRLIQDPNLLYSLEGFLSSSKVAQIFFFERHPYIDGLCTGYSQLIRLYAQEKKTQEAQLFAACLLHFGSILSENSTEASAYIQQINQIAINSSIHPFVQARKIMAKLLDAKSKNDHTNINEWTITAFREEKKQKRYPVNEAYFPFFQFILADAFNLIGRYNEALDMINIAETEYRKSENSPIECGYYSALYLFQAIGLIHTGNRPLCKKILKNIGKQEFIFTSHKYFLIQKLLLELQLTNPKSLSKQQSLRSSISKLVQETGFTIFSV